MGGLAHGRAFGRFLGDVSLGNCCCCAWLVTGGLLAAYVLQSGTTQPITLGDGALVGLLAGLFGAVVNMVVSVPMNMYRPVPAAPLPAHCGLPSPTFLTMSGSWLTTWALAPCRSSARSSAFFMMLILGAIFSSLGGLLGAFFFKKKIVPEPPPPPFPTGSSGAFPDV